LGIKNNPKIAKPQIAKPQIARAASTYIHNIQKIKRICNDLKTLTLTTNWFKPKIFIKKATLSEERRKSAKNIKLEENMFSLTEQ
jgi:hypothetical protein